MKGRVLLCGATSGIGRALGRELARAGASPVLAGRDADELERQAADLRVRFGVDARTAAFRAENPHAARALVAEIDSLDGTLLGVIACQGVMPETERLRREPVLLRELLRVNVESVVALLEPAAEILEARRSGFLCALSSVAGDRGRPGNDLYGASKAALQTYLQALHTRLLGTGVAVLDVRPGMVDTGMSYAVPRAARGAAPPERVARDTVARLARGRGGVLYTPALWRWIMLVIRQLPARLIQRLGL